MTYASEVAADTPWGYWKFDDASGSTATDSSGNSRHLTLSGTYTRNVTGISSLLGAATQVGTDVYAEATSAPGSPMATAWTVECWYKPSNWSGGAAKGIFQTGSSFVTNDGVWSIRHSDTSFLEGQIQVVRNDGGGASMVLAAPWKALTNGMPQHLVITYDGSSALRIYRNGLVIASTTGVGAASPGT
ncbi:MAG: Concanavalin A-like lectin/glucanase superfamily, partial [Pseudomonadota bacterium]